MSVPIEERPFTSQCIDVAASLQIPPAVVERIPATPIGEFRSLGSAGLLGYDFYVGFKRISNPTRRWAHEAALADKVMARFPETIHAFPLFTLPMIAQSDDHARVGLLTEDFTNNGEISLEEYRRRYSFTVKRDEIISVLEKKVFDALDRRVYKEAFQHMAGLAGEREVMIDYNDVLDQNPSDIAAYEEVANFITQHVSY